MVLVYMFSFALTKKGINEDLVGSCEGQAKGPLDQVVDHQLGGDNRRNVHQARRQAQIEAREAVLLVDITHDFVKALGAGALVGGGQDHVAGLGGHAGDHCGEEGGCEGDGPLPCVLGELGGLEEGVQGLGDEVEGHLLAHRVGNLLGEHGGQPCEAGEQSPLPSQSNQAGDHVLVGPVRVPYHLDASLLHGAQHNCRDGPRAHAGKQQVEHCHGREVLEHHLEELIKAELQAALETVAHDRGA
mmetsp:Transcript_28505/g.63189  ORF Transcript_28505/g.63189 Transcript_28505/m.63189 type:complete len:244 (+) Transcript_28505:21-752(+)